MSGDVDAFSAQTLQPLGVRLRLHRVKCASARAFLNSAFIASEMPWLGLTSNKMPVAMVAAIGSPIRPQVVNQTYENSVKLDAKTI